MKKESAGRTGVNWRKTSSTSSSCTSRWPSIRSKLPPTMCRRRIIAIDRSLHGTQECTEYPELFPVTKPIIKRAAFAQASGEVRYTQDIPVPTGGLHAAMVKSSRAHARFSSHAQGRHARGPPGIAPSGSIPDFKALITVADIPAGGEKLIGMGDDDPVFSDGLVTSVGAPIGLAVAETIATARESAAFIESECIAYEDLPAVLTLERPSRRTLRCP